jgi:RNA polymerase sigma factor (sigma-70 family)
MVDDNAGGRWIDDAFARHGRALVGYAAHLVGRHRADDVVQEAFARLCSQPADSVRLPEWLFTVTRRLAIDALRKDGRMRLAADSTLDDPADDLPNAVETRDASRSALEHLATLPSRQQEALRLKFQHELSYADIARVMHTTTNNVGVLVHTGLKALRQKMSDV